VDALFATGPATLVIEECMVGEEVSFFVACDGETAVPLGSAQDYKRVGEGDTGPNTGGMGAYSPAAVFTPELEARTMREIIVPTLAEMARRGTPYQGILFAGLMLTADGPKLIEYNCRFGDPEAEVILPRLQSDALDLFLALATGRLADVRLEWDARTALTVVMAARGYPGTPETGGEIEGLADAEAAGARVFHAGTRLDGERVVAAGGRVLAVTGMGAGVADAAARAYAAVEKVRWREGFFRRDIGHRAIARERDGRA
jgi:phosphoribosylamine--glycine ligase